MLWPRFAMGEIQPGNYPKKEIQANKLRCLDFMVTKFGMVGLNICVFFGHGSGSLRPRGPNISTGTEMF